MALNGITVKGLGLFTMVAFDGFVFHRAGKDLVGEAKLVVEFAGDLGLLFKDLILLDKNPGLFQLLERFGGFVVGEQAAAFLEGFLLGRSAPGEGGHQANGSQKPADPVGGILRGAHGCWW